MGRSDLTPYVTTCAGGINQNAEIATRDECADALNVWAPNGRVVSRPGYVGYGTVVASGGDTAVAGEKTLVESVIGTIVDTTTLNDVPVGGRWYAGFTTEVTADATGLFVGVTSFNANDVGAMLEYWNGTEWVQLSYVEAASFVMSTKHLSLGSTRTPIHFVWPRDFALTTVAGFSRYWFRFTLTALNSGTALDPAVAVSNVLSYRTQNTTGVRHQYSTILNFDGSTRYLNLDAYSLVTAGTENGVADYRSSLDWRAASVSTEFREIQVVDKGFFAFKRTAPPSVAVVQAAREAFIAYGNKVTIHKQEVGATTDVADMAVVETGDFAVGARAPYAKDFVAQRADWPAAKHILFHQNRLWYTTDYSVGWTPPVPYHKVFPLLSEEPVVGAGKVTGLATLGEQAVLFTEDGIFLMVLRGVNAFGLAEFIPTRRVSGIGCAANTSIQQINGELVFLYKDGLYAFDGRNARKVSARDGADRLQDFFGSVTDGRREHAVAVNWKQYGHYLLALSVDGAEANNRVLAWDYENDRFWIWDDIEVQGWHMDGKLLYFTDFSGRVFEFGKGHTSHGAAIEGYVVTQRVGYRQRNQIKAEEVAVWANNMSRSLTLDVLPNDADSNRTAALSMRDPTEKDDTALTVDVDKWHLSKQRMRRLGFEITCNHCQVKVLHNTKNKPFELSSIQLGYAVLGAR